MGVGSVLALPVCSVSPAYEQGFDPPCGVNISNYITGVRCGNQVTSHFSIDAKSKLHSNMV